MLQWSGQTPRNVAPCPDRSRNPDKKPGGCMTDGTIEKAAMRKVYLRILPLTVIMYFLCYIDRINVSFAALTMNKDIGLDAWTYGISSSAFYLGYVVFEIPSNLV